MVLIIKCWSWTHQCCNYLNATDTVALTLNFILGFSKFAAFDSSLARWPTEEGRGGAATSGSSGAHNSLAVGTQGRENRPDVLWFRRQVKENSLDSDSGLSDAPSTGEMQQTAHKDTHVTVIYKSRIYFKIENSLPYQRREWANVS